MIIQIASIAFIGWLLFCGWKIIRMATENALNEAEKGNFEPLHTLTNTEGNLKS